MIKIQTISLLLVASFLSAKNVLAITYPISINNQTGNLPCAVNLMNGKITKIKSGFRSYITALADPTILAGEQGSINVTLGGNLEGLITFQYEVIPAGMEENDAPQFLKVTYRTAHIDEPIVQQIPKNLKFSYDTSQGYTLQCKNP